MRLALGLVLILGIVLSVLPTKSETLKKETEGRKTLDTISQDFSDGSKRDGNHDVEDGINPVEVGLVDDDYLGYNLDDAYDEDDDSDDKDEEEMSDKETSDDDHDDSSERENENHVKHGSDEESKTVGENEREKDLDEGDEDKANRNDDADEEEEDDDDEEDEDDEDAEEAKSKEDQSEDSKSDESLGDEGDDSDEGGRVPTIGRILDGRDYVDDNFLAEEDHGEDDPLDETVEYDDDDDDEFDDKEYDQRNNEMDSNYDEDEDDDEEEEEEVTEEEWIGTGVHFRNSNQKDEEEEEEDGHKGEFPDWNFFGSTHPIVIGAVVGMVFLAGLVIGLVVMVVACRAFAKSRGFTRLEKCDEFSSQTPIYKKVSNSKCEVVDV